VPGTDFRVLHALDHVPHLDVVLLGAGARIVSWDLLLALLRQVCEFALEFALAGHALVVPEAVARVMVIGDGARGSSPGC